ncbi:EF-hand domain-containing protein [Paraglaciecola aquimarina]|uniref:EF-hand domain-containing protein n=1 Tax=Paraglaciecola algarum TaxID=3050085 RepID=A0ABS9D7Q5_9ALTE|nr:EF-hand domain-containing protein [Paraglaciecola sp. G1-23]MCF2948988.1 EF-hand domain-containing protein [Paraglaciecola sp. G1-23]
MTKVLIVLTASLFSLAITAQQPEDNFSKLDTNNDGLISIDEAKSDPTLAQVFTELDTDEDGYLSKDELAELGKKLN